MIYVATAPGAAWVKIGFTNYPRQRLVDMRRTTKRRIVHFVALAGGSLRDEQRIHEALADHRIGPEAYPA